MAVKEAEECVGELTSLLVGYDWASGVLLRTQGLPGLVCRALAEGPADSDALLWHVWIWVELVEQGRKVGQKEDF